VTFQGHSGDLLAVVTLCAQLTRDLLAIAKFLFVDTDFYIAPAIAVYYFASLVFLRYADCNR